MFSFAEDWPKWGMLYMLKIYNYRTRALNSDDTITEGTEVLQGIEDVTKAILQFYDRTKIRHDFYMDFTAPSFPPEFQAI